jgi:hypothetical protein
MAFDNQIVDWKEGPRSEVQKWANELEISLIAEHGGPLRDPSVRCKQTLNLTKGGKGHRGFEAIDASRTVAWLHFQDELGQYAECYETSLVPQPYINDVSGYQLGRNLSMVRQGQYWKGHPDETSRIKWLESLPDWAWNARDTDEYRQKASVRAKKQFESQEARDELSDRAKKQFASQEARDELSDRAKKQFASQESRNALSERAKTQWANADEDTRAEWCRKNSEAHNRPCVKAAASERAKAQWSNADEATRAEWSRKQSESKSTTEYKVAASERAKKQFKSQEARDALSERAKKQFESKQARDVQSDRAEAQWANATEETRTEWARKQSEAHNRSEVRAAASERAKKQFESQEARDALSERAKAQAVREAAEGKKSLSERSREWRLQQQDVKMASLTSDKEREQYQCKIDSEARKSARKKRQLDALRQVPGWEDAKQRDIPEARTAGVLPSID